MPDSDADEGRRLGGSTAARVGAAVFVVVVAVGAFGAAGLLVSVSLVAVSVAAVALSRIPAAPVVHRRSQPGPPVADAPFRSYRAVAEALSWADVSPRHYDLVTRPLFVQLLASRLADRHRVDLAADPEPPGGWWATRSGGGSTPAARWTAGASRRAWTWRP